MASLSRFPPRRRSRSACRPTRVPPRGWRQFSVSASWHPLRRRGSWSSPATADSSADPPTARRWHPQRPSKQSRPQERRRLPWGGPLTQAAKLGQTTGFPVSRQARTIRTLTRRFTRFQGTTCPAQSRRCPKPVQGPTQSMTIRTPLLLLLTLRRPRSGARRPSWSGTTAPSRLRPPLAKHQRGP